MGIRRRWGRNSNRGFSVLETIFVLLTLSVFLGLAMVAYLKYQERIYLRLCFGQQRTLQGQIESMQTIDLDVPMDEVYAQLVKGGLLSGTLAGERSVETVKLNDPGSGDRSYGNYLLMPGSKMVGCRVHGSPYAEEP